MALPAKDLNTSSPYDTTYKVDGEKILLTVKEKSTGRTKTYDVKISDVKLSDHAEKLVTEIAMDAFNLLCQRDSFSFELKEAKITPLKVRDEVKALVEAKYTSESGRASTTEEVIGEHVEKLQKSIERVNEIAQRVFKPIAPSNFKQTNWNPPELTELTAKVEKDGKTEIDEGEENHAGMFNRSAAEHARKHGRSQNREGLSLTSTSQPASSTSSSSSSSSSVLSSSQITSKPKKLDSNRATVFIAKGGKSQHSPCYEVMIGSSKKKEEINFAVAACTPLAISFAVSAKNGPVVNSDENTPGDVLDSFFANAHFVKRGIASLKAMNDNNHRHGVNLDENAMNLNGEAGLEVFNAMNESHIVAKKEYCGDDQKYFDMNVGHITTSPNWYKKVLKALENGEGALVIFGGYSIGVRCVNNAYEIFDSHNANAYNLDEDDKGINGACVIHCPTRQELDTYIDKIYRIGSGEGIEIHIF